ncbi:MAG: PIN domain-containing protein [Acidimicrobiales bacterium]
MAVAGWVLDKSAAARSDRAPIDRQLAELSGLLWVCPIGELEQLYSARSARDYDELKAALLAGFALAAAPADILDRALLLQQDLAHHHGMWHRTPIPDLLIAETAIHHGLGVVHVDGDFDRIAEVRPLTTRRLG